MKTRFILFTMLFAVMSCGLFAQQEKPLHYYQLGLNFSSLNSFGVHFKTGSEKTLFRATLLSLNLVNGSTEGRPRDSIDSKITSYGAGLRVGFERHVPVFARLNFIWGIEAGFNYTYQKQDQNLTGIYNDITRTSWTMAPMVDVVLGLTYTLSDHLVFGAELAPYVQYSFGKINSKTYSATTESTAKSFNFGFTNGAANLTLAYRFGK